MSSLNCGIGEGQDVHIPCHLHIHDPCHQCQQWGWWWKDIQETVTSVWMEEASLPSRCYHLSRVTLIPQYIISILWRWGRVTSSQGPDGGGAPQWRQREGGEASSNWLKAASVVVKEFQKAPSTHLKGFLEATWAENFSETCYYGY